MDNLPNLPYAVEKLAVAVDELQGSGYVRERLYNACMKGLVVLFPDDFPDNMRGEYEQILEAISWLPPSGGPDAGIVETTINSMSTEEAKALVKRISSFYTRAKDALYEDTFVLLEKRAAAGGAVEIPLENGGVARFPESALKEAFLNAAERLRGGAGAVEEHPLCTAARNSSDPQWRKSFYASFPVAGGDERGDIPDLSE